MVSENVKNELPVVIDLFSGCGGLAFGFKSAGYKILHGVEIMKAAINTASYNLYWRDGLDAKHHWGDITELNPELFKKDIGESGCIVIGGPPCQAYSQIGRAKLKSLGEDRKHTNDSRGFLFQDFLRFALELDARAIVMENVPEAVDYGGLNVPQHVCDILEENNYQACWTILNAADFGVPQVRERIFVFAVKKNVTTQTLNLPTPTHSSQDSKAVQGQLRRKKIFESKSFRIPNIADSNLPNWVTVRDAVSDLPSLFPTAKSKYHLYKPNIQLFYNSEASTDYQRLMRNWFGRGQKSVTGHGYRRTERDFPIFERMRPGDDYRDASIIAEEMLDEVCRAESVDRNLDVGIYENLRQSIVPPYDREKFHTKWKKMPPDKPAHTLVAHLSTDTYSHLHPWEPRGISVREAARLQSFPDGFLFQCNMGDAFKQIGNAVPPLLSKAIALAMRKNLLNYDE
ncbi:DNA cytosine methyltransferase [Paenibacillus lignilyticus]|uniref:DNA cytosine methyltransferase n=1 Tax=Paenibacillus lignilyticus TaxID=1172615 RepID=UPI001F0B13AB|nr:DNA cytosine methyltransferase [Paenibacillus lignilyticus]